MRFLNSDSGNKKAMECYLKTLMEKDFRYISYLIYCQYIIQLGVIITLLYMTKKLILTFFYLKHCKASSKITCTTTPLYISSSGYHAGTSMLWTLIFLQRCLPAPLSYMTHRKGYTDFPGISLLSLPSL